jgi:hypothetical protein
MARQQDLTAMVGLIFYRGLYYGYKRPFVSMAVMQVVQYGRHIDPSALRKFVRL